VTVPDDVIGAAYPAFSDVVGPPRPSSYSRGPVPAGTEVAWTVPDPAGVGLDPAPARRFRLLPRGRSGLFSRRRVPGPRFVLGVAAVFVALGVVGFVVRPDASTALPPGRFVALVDGAPYKQVCAYVLPPNDRSPGTVGPSVVVYQYSRASRLRYSDPSSPVPEVVFFADSSWRLAGGQFLPSHGADSVVSPSLVSRVVVFPAALAPEFPVYSFSVSSARCSAVS
jgi:hypothetical protein